MTASSRLVRQPERNETQDPAAVSVDQKARQTEGCVKQIEDTHRLPAGVERRCAQREKSGAGVEQVKSERGCHPGRKIQTEFRAH